uniref:Uncharacterized protein n=1 Tax=Crocodylus porosus TaxID=8502 RepID=A0A7M4EF36_CROPO
MEMRMGKSRIDTQRSDLQRRKRRMKWIQRDRRQKMGLQLESSLRIHAPSISLPSSPCLYCPFSLWLHTVSDEGGLKNGEHCSEMLRKPPTSLPWPAGCYAQEARNKE